MKCYKGFEKGLVCRGKQYAVGKLEEEPEASVCNSGMHACKNPLDVLHYYGLRKDNVFHEVECDGKISESNDDSKISCTKMTVGAEISLAEMIKIGISAVFERARNSTGAASGNCSTGAASGYRSTGAASGYCSTGAASGNCSTGAASGYYSTGAASGDYSTGAASGYRSTGAASGNCSTGAASGNCSTGAASGYCSTGAASGDCSTGAASGNCSTGAASGYYSTGAASGYYSTGAASGNYSTAIVSGKYSIAVSNGACSKAKGAIGCYLVLTEYDSEKLVYCKMRKVDGKRIKANVFYTLKNGEFVQWKDE